MPAWKPETRHSAGISIDQIAAAFDLKDARLDGTPRHGGGHLMFPVKTRQGKFALIRSRPRSNDDQMRQERVKRKLERQNILLRYLADQGFPVAPPLVTRDGSTLLSINGIAHALYPYVDGRHMERNNHQQLSEVASMLASYHRLTAEYPHADHWPIENYPELFHERHARFNKDVAVLEPLSSELGISRSLKLFETTLSSVEEKLGRLRYEDLSKAVIHNDIRRENLLFSGDKLVALLDFNRSVYGPRVLDLTTAFSNLVSPIDNTIFVDSSHGFTTAYNKHVRLSPVEMESLPILTEARIAWKAFRKVRKMASKEVNRQRRARKFHKYVQQLSWLEDHWSAWQGVFS